MQDSKNQRRKIRLIFIATFGLLGLQILITLNFGEPYPAITMPGFGVTNLNSHFKRSGMKNKWSLKPEVAFFEDGAPTHTFAWGTILSPIQNSHYGAISVLLLDTLDAANRPLGKPTLFEKVFYSVFPGYQFSVRHPTNIRNRDSLRVWLAARGREILPGHRLSRAEIRWFHDTYDIQNQTKSSRELVMTLRVDFTGNEPNEIF